MQIVAIGNISHLLPPLTTAPPPPPLQISGLVRNKAGNQAGNLRACVPVGFLNEIAEPATPYGGLTTGYPNMVMLCML